jgi:hypothetical protein
MVQSVRQCLCSLVFILLIVVFMASFPGCKREKEITPADAEAAATRIAGPPPSGGYVSPSGQAATQEDAKLEIAARKILQQKGPDQSKWTDEEKGIFIEAARRGLL